MTVIRVLIADDHPVVRAGLRAVLDTAAGIEVIAETGAAAEAVARCAQRPRPDVVLMDLRFGEAPGAATASAGAAATAEIRALADPPQVLVVTNYSSDADVLGAISAGAVGYLLKDADPADLVAGVRDAAAGRTVLSADVAGRLLARTRNPGAALTPREAEVLALVAEGLGNRAIARRLHLTEATVKSHLVHVFTKLGVGSRTAAVAAAVERGIL